jgi:UDP-sugar pyrophosphorylase
VSDFTISQQLECLEPEDQATLKLIDRLSQQHLVAHWPGPGQAAVDKHRLLAQVRELNASYPGGLERYLANAAELLEQSRSGEPPYRGYVPKVPSGIRIDYGSEEFSSLEGLGLEEINRCGFVLVAGGLGERLGYPGIKVALPAETASNDTFLAHYVKCILALQQYSNRQLHASRELPLAIMTSDDTDSGTRRLLADNGYFGMREGQIALLKQERVAAIADPTPRLALSSDDPFSLVTKPHGHGDVHTLLHTSGVAKRWLDAGLRWLVFFQDTNALTFNAVLATLGVSQRERFDVNSIVVPRVPGEAAGGLVQLVGADAELTVNVEYNQLDALLRASPDGAGDVADESGYSPYPANTNILALALAPYVETLERTGGAVPEFINPKYTDASRTAFKSATRLECMMQDYPRLAVNARVGFTQFERQVCFSPVKNSLDVAAARQAQSPPLPAESASTGEADVYAMHRRLLRLAGAEVEDGPSQQFRGVALKLFPVVSISPTLTMPVEALRKKLHGVRVSAKSALVIEAEDVEIDGLQLDGALHVKGVPGARIVLADLVVDNHGWQAREIAAADEALPEVMVRGFRFVRNATLVIEARHPGEYVVDRQRLRVASSATAQTRIVLL